MKKPLTLRWFQQAHAAHQAGRLEHALPLYRRILAREPANIPALYGIGLVAWQLGMNDEALRFLLQVVARRPDYADAHYNLGVVRESLGQWEHALASYRDALSLRPDFGDAWEGIGKALHALGSVEDAVQCYARALRAREGTSALSPETRYNMAYSLLALGRWEEGWEAYEARFQSPVFLAGYTIQHHEALWDGSPLDGRRLIVHAEQGFGDSLMMARYLHQITGGEVVIEVQRPLVRLFDEQSFPNHQVIAQKQSYPPCDVQLPMMSLAHRFRMNATSVPTDPYLRAPSGPILPSGDGLKVGFVWAGSPDHRKDKFRSIALEHWKPLWGLPGITWYSLQVDQEPMSAPCHNLKPLIRDFADTAALMAQLDLVISCDTSVAHLAGALGKPVWTLLPTVPDFRWGMEGDRTCWYPSMALIRQGAAHDWPGVMARVVEGLQALTVTEAA